MKKSIHFLALLLIVTAIKAQQPKLMMPIGHTGEGVLCASYSPDGKYIVTGSMDGTAKVWNAISGQLITDLKGPNIPKQVSNWVVSASFSPDGKYIVTASYDEIARVWNAVSGELVTELKGHTSGVLSTSFSPACPDDPRGGKYIITTSEDYKAKIWNAFSGHLVADLQGYTNAYSIASFSPDGKYIVSVSYTSDTTAYKTASVWNAVNGQLLINLKGHTNYVRSASFSPDGKYIVTASNDSTAKVWNAVGGQLVADLKGHTGRVLSASFSPDGKYIVTSSDDSTAKVWHAITGVLVTNLIGHTGHVWKASFSPDGKYIVTACGEKLIIEYNPDKTIRVWNAFTGQLVANLEGHASKVCDVSFSPDGKYIVTASEDNTARVWNAITGKPIAILEGHSSGENNASFSPDGKYIVTASYNNIAKVWDALSGRLVANLKGHISEVHTANFSLDGKYIVTASGNRREFDLGDHTAKVWDALSGKLIADLKGHTSAVFGAIFSPDGKFIATTSADHTVKVWDAINGNLVADLKAPASWISGTSFSSDGKYILTHSEDNRAWAWNAFSGQIITEIKLNKSSKIWSASFSPDGKYIVTASLDSTAKVWNVSNGQLVADLKGHTGKVISATFSPDGKYIVTGSRDSTVKVWNTFSGTLVANLNGFTSWVYRVVFSPDGKYIVTFSLDNTVRVWDADSWKLIKRIEGNNNSFRSVDFKNKRIASIDNSEVSIFDLESGKKLYTFFAVDSTDYLVFDKDKRYDGTPAARKLLYFTCGREIIELDQVKDQLWVPNLAERIMRGDSINAKTLDELNICGLTPEVEDSSYKPDEYCFKILPRRGGLGETVLYLNGIEVKRYKPAELKNSGGTFELKIKKTALKDLFVAGKENRLTVKAFTSDNAISSRALNISEDKSTDKATAPNLFAVMVGVSDYKGDELDLKYPGKDATDISAVVSNAAKKLLNTDGAEHVFMYNLTTDKDHYQLPEKKSIKKVLEEIGMKATANDILLIFFAGHGVLRGSGNNKQFYFLTADASLNSSFGAVADVGISTSELTEWIKPANIKAQKRIMIFDACNSGQAIKDFVKLGNKDQEYIAARSDEKGQEIKAIEKLNNQSGLFILSASASNLAAYEMGRYSQGLLTYSLLKAIKQQPDILNEGKYLDVSKWFNAARESVSALSKETGARQDPQIVTNTNFNIGVVDEAVMAKIVLQNEKPLFAACNFQNEDENNPVDNLGLNKLIDQQLNSISSRGIDAPIVYAGITSSANAYSLSGRYTITGNTITIKVFIIQNKEVKQKIDLAGTKDKLDELTALIATQAAVWAEKNK